MSDPSDRTDCWCAKGKPCGYHEGAIDMAEFMQARIDELEAALRGAQKTNGRLVVEKLDLKRQLHRALDQPDE